MDDFCDTDYLFAIVLCRVQGHQWMPRVRSVYSEETLQRIDTFIDAREKVFLVLFPVYQDAVLRAGDFLLTHLQDYEVQEKMVLDQTWIYVLTRSLR